ncbi:MAG: hypothetical protein WCF33_12115 [Pseudonocardiaceae bacterium]
MAEARGVLITVALIGAAGAVIAALITSSGKELIPGSPGPSQVASGRIFPKLPLVARPSVFLSRDSGPAGTVVRVSGEGFAPGERVVLRFHTEQIGSTTADGAGKFSNVAVTIPGSFAKFAPQQFSVSAVGHNSVGHDEAPFTITG